MSETMLIFFGNALRKNLTTKQRNYKNQRIFSYNKTRALWNFLIIFSRPREHFRQTKINYGDRSHERNYRYDWAHATKICTNFRLDRQNCIENIIRVGHKGFLMVVLPRTFFWAFRKTGENRKKNDRKLFPEFIPSFPNNL